MGAWSRREQLGSDAIFVEFLKTGGLFDKWVVDCPLRYRSGNAPEKRNVLGTLALSVLAGHWRYAHINAIRGDGIKNCCTPLEALAASVSLIASIQEPGRRAAALLPKTGRTPPAVPSRAKDSANPRRAARL